jgi:N-acetyl sugar amidotransferase
MTVISTSSDIFFCTRCVVSNQRPRITFDDEGVCSACQHAWRKQNVIDWDARDQELRDLCDQHRSKTGSFDVIVPGSGGKDSAFVAHTLKHDYGMHPLTITWAPHIYTDIGWSNLQGFVHAGFDDIMGIPNGEVHRRLTRLSFTELGDPFQPFIYGQKAFPLRMAVKLGIPLVMYGEDGDVEYGGETKNADRSTIDLEKDMQHLYFSGVDVDQWKDHGFTDEELQFYQLPSIDEMRKAQLDYRHMSYYKKWNPQENYYYAAEHTNFRANPTRSEGTYSKYASLDDRLDGFHYYLAFIKFGIGRATSDAAHEIRDGHLTREEGVALVHKYDGEFPQKHYEEFLEYTELTDEEFWRVVDSYRHPHIWEKVDDDWKLRQQVS